MTPSGIEPVTFRFVAPPRALRTAWCRPIWDNSGRK